MSEFFKSEMVRGDLQEMMELQKYCFLAANAFPVLSFEKKVEYFDVLETFIEKQKIFNTRIALSDDPEAKDMLKSMKDAAVMLGAPEDQSLTECFDKLLIKVKEMKEQLVKEEG